MKKIVLSALLAMAAVVALPQAQAQTVCPTAPAPVVVSTNITQNTTWTRNNIYLIQGFVFVEAGATLTIESGTIIKGDKPTKGTLTIKQGGRISAVGTPTQPIVFTSNQPAGSRDRGDWGGVILAGRAPQNVPPAPGQPLPKIEGGLTPDTYFGGNDPLDNSGIMQYVRIEFPGVAYSLNNEINGLTLCGVGSGTTLDHIQVSYSGDDSYEWFGGTVNAKYLIALNGQDDEWDTDNGFSGKVQFGVALRNPLFADQSGSNGFEADNDANGTNNQPLTGAVFSNMTNILPPAPAGQVLDPLYRRGMHLRRNATQSIFNSLSIGYPVGLLLDEGATAPFPTPNVVTNVTNNGLQLAGNVFAGYATARKATRVNGSTFNVKQFLEATNDTTSTVASLLLNPNNFAYMGASGNPQQTPDFQLAAASPLNTGAVAFTGKLADPAFAPVNYRGAFGAVNWTAGWSNFNPQITCYNRPGQVLAAKAAADESLELGVYPNPVTSAAKLSFTVATATTATVRVLDATGRLVATVAAGQKLASGPQIIALPAGLKPGLYVATVATAETMQSVRFVVAQ